MISLNSETGSLRPHPIRDMAGKFRKTIQKLSVVLPKIQDQKATDPSIQTTASAAPETGDVSSNPSNPQKKPATPDLSDPTSYELLLDDDAPATPEEAERLKKTKSRLSIELRYQKGISLEDEHIRVPGRIPLMPVSLLETLFTVIGFSAGLIHFSVISPNYLLALIIISLLLFSQIVIYHSAYRTMRLTITIIQTIGTIALMALVGWAFYDLIAFNPKHSEHPFLLILTLVAFELVPILMFLHLVFLGRGYRKIKIATLPDDTQAETEQKISFLPRRSKNTLRPIKAPQQISNAQADAPKIQPPSETQNIKSASQTKQRSATPNTNPPTIAHQDNAPASDKPA